MEFELWEEFDKEAIGTVLQYYQETSGQSKRQFAERLHLSPSFYCEIEQGKKRISGNKLPGFWEGLEGIGVKKEEFLNKVKIKEQEQNLKKKQGFVLLSGTEIDMIAKWLSYKKRKNFLELTKKREIQESLLNKCKKYIPWLRDKSLKEEYYQENLHHIGNEEEAFPSTNQADES